MNKEVNKTLKEDKEKELRGKISKLARNIIKDPNQTPLDMHKLIQDRSLWVNVDSNIKKEAIIVRSEINKAICEEELDLQVVWHMSPFVSWLSAIINF